MEGDILAYLNQKEFPTRTYPRTVDLARPSVLPFPPPIALRKAHTSYRVCLLSPIALVRSALVDATRSIASVEGVIDVPPA